MATVGPSWAKQVIARTPPVPVIVVRVPPVEPGNTVSDTPALDTSKKQSP